ncbi:acyltransferase family protein [Gaetbulibacter aestuarii]|uniref:Acyltransferase family protein n=1 Tax=Gaetbulibacter aestuarii TaxID=1502358 RepID=A0ABW7N0W9_9FLAO
MIHKTNKKIPWIDVIKGLGILSVVIGHVFTGEVRHIMFIFHMPLFFFMRLSPVDLLDFMNYVTKALYGGTKLYGALGVFWFITCLFLIQQIMNFLIIKLKTKILTLIISFLLVFSYFNMIYFPEFSLPWNAHVVLASAPIFYLGFLFKNFKLEINNYAILVMGLIVIVFSYFYPANFYDMKFTNYGITLITLLSSLILILNLKIISTKLSNDKGSKIIFSELGKASMVVMYLHQPIQFLTSSYIADNPFFRVFFAIILSYVIYRLFLSFKISRLLFLGSYQDFKNISKMVFDKNKIINIGNKDIV